MASHSRETTAFANLDSSLISTLSDRAFNANRSLYVSDGTTLIDRKYRNPSTRPQDREPASFRLGPNRTPD